MKLGIVVIATCFLWNSIMCFSRGEFRSHLKTMVDAPITSVFRIPGPNGYCAHADGYINLLLYTCTPSNPVQNFTYHDDGTLRINNKCVAADGFTQGSYVVMYDCKSPATSETIWRFIDRQIVNPASGLVITGMFGTSLTRLTLEANVFSSYQTWRFFDYNPTTPTAYIIGLNNFCLHISANNSVWLGVCGSTGTPQKWFIYADGTIRPESNSNACLSFNNYIDRVALVTSCGLAPTNERWLLTSNGTLLNEQSSLVLDVAEADPSLNKITVHPVNGKPNQQWKMFYPCSKSIGRT